MWKLRCNIDSRKEPTEGSEEEKYKTVKSEDYYSCIKASFLF